METKAINNYPKKIILLAVIFILMVSATARLLVMLPERSTKDDFSHYYIATKIFLAGEDPYKVNLAPLYEKYSFNLELDQEVKTPYPPIFFALMAPFAIFQPSTAFTAWAVFQFICLIYILIIVKYLTKKYLTNLKWLFLCLLILLSSFIYYHFYYSQITLFLVALILSAYALSTPKYRHIANLLVSTAGLVKIYPFILLPWFIFRHFKNKKNILFSDFFVIGGGILIVVSATGWDLWFSFIERTLNSSIDESFGIYYNYSLPSFIVNYTNTFSGITSNEISRSLIVPAGLLIGITIIVISYFWCIKHPKSKTDGFCLITITMLLSFPRILGHYYVFLIFPLTVVYARNIGSSIKQKTHLLLFILVYIILNLHHLPFFVLPFFHSNPSFFFILSLNYVPFWGLVGLYYYYWQQVKKQHFLKCSQNPTLM